MIVFLHHHHHHPENECNFIMLFISILSIFLCVRHFIFLQVKYFHFQNPICDNKEKYRKRRLHWVQQLLPNTCAIKFETQFYYRFNESWEITFILYCKCWLHYFCSLVFAISLKVLEMQCAPCIQWDSYHFIRFMN